MPVSPRNATVARELKDRLEHLTGSPAKIAPDPSAPHGAFRLLARTPRHSFACEVRPSGTLGVVNRALEEIRSQRPRRGAISLLVVPYMGAAGRSRCREAGVAWLDLSGNAEIHHPGLLIRVEGHPDRYKRRGRPWSVFAAKSSRVARLLLQEPRRFQTQRQIAKETDLSESFVSQIVHRLEEDALLTREPGSRGVRPREARLLLDAWAERYDFLRHEVTRGHVSAPSGEVVLRKLSEALGAAGLSHAATGLAGAWLLAPFATFRTTTLYVAENPDADLLAKVGFRESDRGANVWLVVPDDAGVFQGSSTQKEIPCVAAVQVYLDLAFHPERAKEAAEHLRREHLTWQEEDLPDVRATQPRT
jgi:hypothetical protein